MTEVWFTIPGKVETNHRARVTRNGTFHAKEYVVYKRAVALAAKASRSVGWTPGGRFEVQVVIREPDLRSRDLDNAAKGILDGCRGVLWDDDRQIDRLVIERGAVDRVMPRAHVYVRRIESSEEAA